MKKKQAETRQTKKKAGYVKRNPERKKPVKRLVTGTTEILDFDLDAEVKRQKRTEKKTKSEKKVRPHKEHMVPKRSKSADEVFGNHMPQRPVSVSQDTMEILDAEELLSCGDQKRSRKQDDSHMDFVPKKHTPAVKKKGKQRPLGKAPGRKAAEKKTAARTVPVRKAERKKAAGRPSGRKKKGGFLEDFSAMDVVIALTGVLVLLAAVGVIGVYSSANAVRQQVEAMAAVGEKLEEIGIAGEGIFTAVADARVAEREAAALPDEDEAFGEYEEKELTTEMNVSLKLTSVQKDLKIKFINKESGKLVGNQAFCVDVAGPESKSFTDEDKDGIIYIKNITPGEYNVTITGPEEIDGNQVAGVKGIVTVKDRIEYKKIDVTDEVKKESEINVAKEDTAVANQVESVLTDTVEWVESTKTPLEEGGSESYEEIKKENIPDPSSSALLDMIWSADTKNGAYLTRNTVKLAENGAFFSAGKARMLDKGVFFTQTETAPVSTEQESTTPAESMEPTESQGPSEPEPPKGEVTGVSISGGGEYTVGDTVKLTGHVETSGDISLAEEDYRWSGDRSGSGKELSFSADQAGSITVRLEVKGKSGTADITVKNRPGEVGGISVSADADRVEVGKSVTIKAQVTMSDGSGYSGNVEWSADRGQLSGSGTSVSLTESREGNVTVKAKAGGKEGSVTVAFYQPDKKVTAIRIPDSVSVVAGGTAGLSLEVQPQDAKDRTVEWKVVEGTDIASVDGNGTVKGVKAGMAKVQAAAKDGSGISSNICTVTVSADIGVTMEAPGKISVGDEKQLKCATSGEMDSVKWSVSDTKIASIEEESGKVKGIAAGKVTVTVRAKGKSGKEVSATGELTVTAAGVEEIRLDPSSLTMKPGERKTVKASVSTKGNKAVEWKSRDESVVKIVESGDDSCVVQGIKPGRVSLTAVSKENKDKTADCEITVELKDGSAPLKDKDGNQLYCKDGDSYREAKASDYYRYDVFYRKKDTTKYKYTGWQTIDGKRYYFDKNGNPVTGEQIIQGMKYTFNSDGSLQVNGVMGIDVSKHNGNIDWNAVKNAGVDFVIIRCGYRGSATGVLVEDQKFKANIQGAAAAGLKVGIYFFSQAVNEVEAVEEASMAVSLIKNYKITYPVYMDVESANGRADGMDAGTRTQVIHAFCKTIQNSGYTAGIYANKTWLGSKMNVGSLGGYRIWLAQYAAAPTYGGRYEMWQYSSKGSISGISGDVDLNISYMSE